MKAKQYNTLLKKQIHRILWNNKLSSLLDLQFSKENSVSILYPTDDYLLNRFQFNALKKVLRKEDKVFLMQMGECDNLDEDHDLYELSYPLSYNEYQRIEELYSITLLFPYPGDWILVIDESLEGGIGLLIGNTEIITLFESYYGRTREDITKLNDFFTRDSKRNVNVLKYREALYAVAMIES